jgi:hypothetical protein
VHNALDFTLILYFAGGVCIINKNNVFHSFFQTGKSHVRHFGCLLLSTCKVKYFNKIIKYIQYVLIIEELKLSSTVVFCTSKC